MTFSPLLVLLLPALPLPGAAQAVSPSTPTPPVESVIYAVAPTTEGPMELVVDRYGAEDVDVAAVIDLRGLFLLPEGAPVPFDGDGPPLILLHGEDDQRIPLGDAEEVFRLAREGGTPVEFHVAPGIGHDLGGAGLLARRLDRERTVLDRIDAFLAAAFAGTPDPVTRLRTRLLPTRGTGTPPPAAATATRPTPGDST